MNNQNQIALQPAKWIAARGELLQDAAKITTITTDIELDVSGGTQTAISKHLKALEKERKSITEPLDKLKKQIMDQEKDLAKPLQAELDRLKKINSDYVTEKMKREEAARIEAMKAQAAAIEAAESKDEADDFFGSDESVIIPDVPDPVSKPKITNNRVVERWSQDIINPDAVPREFCSPDESKIRKYRDYCVGIGKEPEIQGVKFTKTMSVEGR